MERKRTISFVRKYATNRHVEIIYLETYRLLIGFDKNGNFCVNLWCIIEGRGFWGNLPKYLQSENLHSRLFSYADKCLNNGNQLF